MNYGELNLPTIPPGSPVPLAERVRPAWLCITAPEHANRGVSEKDLPDLTPEQIAEAEAEDLRREDIREAISRAKQAARLSKHEPTFGESIRAFRELHHLSRIGLSRLLGCTYQSVVNWEHEKCIPYRANIEKIAELDKATGYQ